jgi:hypothetical protein
MLYSGVSLVLSNMCHVMLCYCIDACSSGGGYKSGCHGFATAYLRKHVLNKLLDLQRRLTVGLVFVIVA